MKKILIAVLAAAILTSTLIAPASAGTGSEGPQAPGQYRQEQRAQGRAPGDRANEPQNGQAGPGGDRRSAGCPDDGRPFPKGQNGDNREDMTAPDAPSDENGGAEATKRGRGTIDFEALLGDGTLSQETYDSIRAYMEARRPSDGQTPSRASGDAARRDLLAELLEAQVITQSEYEAITAAINADGQAPNDMPEAPADGQAPDGMPGVPADGQAPADKPGDSRVPGAPGGAEANVEYSAAVTITGDADGGEYASTADGENAVLVAGGDVTLTNATITKSGSTDGESADFYGMNAAVLASGGATLTIDGATVATDGAHANGVFSYGSGTTVNVSNTTITTSGNNSGGLMTTGGAAMNAFDLTVSTAGNSSAAIRSDRGGGTVTVAGGTYETAGVGSPAIYSTADISVSDATLAAASSEAVVIEGGNSVTLENVQITGCDSTLNGQSTQKTNVLIYQSMSGDASEGSSAFTMTGGAMAAGTGSMFHVTNVTTTITLENVAFTYASDSDVFLDASADAWGASGSNGANVTLKLVGQDITGAIHCDSASSVVVDLDDASSWTLTGDSYVTALNGDMSHVNTNGYTLYVNGEAVA